MENEKIGQEFERGTKRIRFLEDNCHATEMYGYTRMFTQDELLQMKDELSETLINIQVIEEEKTKVMNAFKAKLKEPVETKASLTNKLRSKSEFITAKCYKFIDERSKTVIYYNEDGIPVSERPMRPEEYQLTIPIGRNGTDNY